MSRAREGDTAVIKVIDKGRGIDAEQLERVFELYGQGLGIELSLVKDLVEAQGGTVGVQSPGLGHGCTFTVCMPLKLKPEPDLSPSTNRDMAGSLVGVRRLLVDDSHDVLEALGMLLEIEEAEVQALATQSKP